MIHKGQSITERLAMNNEAKKLLRAFAKADKAKADSLTKYTVDTLMIS